MWWCLVVIGFSCLNWKQEVAAADRETLFDTVENLYSDYFPPTQPTRTLLSFTYRFYPSTGVYLAINSEDNGVYLLGGPLGDGVMFVGSVDVVETMLGISGPTGNHSLYMLEYESKGLLAQFHLIEPSNALVLAAGETINESCLLTGPRNFSRLAGSSDQPFLLHVTTTPAGQKIRIFSEYANQPLLRFVTCDDFNTEHQVNLAAPVQVTGCTLEDVSGCTVAGPVATPYEDCSLAYAGAVWVRITGDEGTYADFQSEILDTIKRSGLWQADDIDVSFYSFPSGQNDLIVDLWIKTERCVDEVAGEFPGNPAVIDAAGRFVQLHYNKFPPAPLQSDCGAYVAPGVWSEFDCYNLAAIGRTTRDDPFVPSWRLIGGYWQWGRKGPSSGQWYNTNTGHFAHGPNGPGPSEANEGFIPEWDHENAPDGAWSDTTKTADDPCPAGYRVPTIAQWEGVIGNNAQKDLGTWSDESTNYSSGIFLGDALMLPAAGSRHSYHGTLFSDSYTGYRGFGGKYWSSSVYRSSACYLQFAVTYADTNYHTRTFGRSVRCIAE